MWIGSWTLLSIWAAGLTETNIITIITSTTITITDPHTILMRTRAILLDKRKLLTVEVELSQLWEPTSGTRFVETITKKVGFLLQYPPLLYLSGSPVERRRRETINEGINELAKIVPNCEKNKGSILQRGVQYITQLKDNETRNIEKWTLEKLLTDQAIAELSSSVERLKNDLNRAYREVERWKRACQDAGLEPKDDGSTDDIGES